MGYFCDRGRVQKTVLGSTHVVEQLLFYIVPSILTFDFDFFCRFLIFGALMGIFGVIFDILGLIGLFLELVRLG